MFVKGLLMGHDKSPGINAWIKMDLESGFI